MLAVGAVGGIGRLGLVAAAVRQLFDPRLEFFSSGEQGVWYDPSDLSTLFQDSAGTTPVTAVEQPVGLMLDKRLGLALGAELITNGDFSNGTTGWTQALGSISVVGGRMRVTRPSAESIGRASTPITCVPGRLYKVEFDRYKGTAVSSGLAIAITSTSVSGAIYVSSSANDGRFTFYFFATQSTHWLFLESGPGAAGIYSEFDNISVKELPGNHVFQTTAIDRPILRQDANGNFYLAANGTNTWMQTNSIDFTGTDKVTEFAGFRKLSDTDGVIAELSAVSSVTQSTFMLSSPPVAGGNLFWRSHGTLARTITGGSAPFPYSAIATGIGDISGDRATLRINGVQVGQNTTDQGTGNYGNYPLYLFRRGGTSLPFNGQFYGLLILGALTSDAQTVAMERWLAPKTGVTLP